MAYIINITGKKASNEALLSGVAIKLSNGDAIYTNESGVATYASFTPITPVSAQASGYSFTIVPNSSENSSSAGNSSSSYTALGTAITTAPTYYYISVYAVSSSGIPLANTEIKFSNGDTAYTTSSGTVSYAAQSASTTPLLALKNGYSFKITQTGTRSYTAVGTSTATTSSVASSTVYGTMVTASSGATPNSGSGSSGNVLTVTVVNSETKQPITGATVGLYAQSTSTSFGTQKTNSSGVVIFSSLGTSSTALTITIGKSGYTSLSSSVASDANTITFALKPLSKITAKTYSTAEYTTSSGNTTYTPTGKTITLTILNSETNQPISGADVTLTSISYSINAIGMSAPQTLGTQTTNSSGVVTFQNVVMSSGSSGGVGISITAVISKSGYTTLYPSVTNSTQTIQLVPTSSTTTQQNYGSSVPTTTPSASSNTLLYVGLGAAALIAVLALSKKG